MAQYVRQMFKTPKAIVSPTLCGAVSGTVTYLTSTAYGENFSLTLNCIVGDIHISTLTTAPTTALGYKLSSGQSIELNVPSYLSLMSTSTTAQYQGIVWEGA